MELFECILKHDDSECGTLVSLVKNYYTEYHRVYHDWSHIKDGVLLSQSLLAAGHMEFDLSIAQQLAWLFHDIVYIPHSECNEQQSVNLMRVILDRLSLDVITEKDIAEASVIIYSTIDHSPRMDSARAIIDMDLYCLSNPSTFSSSNIKLIQEFNVNEDIFERERKQFLKNKILSKEYIYHSNLGRHRWEHNARAILTKYVE